MEATYLSCAETAKLVRAALRRSFPRTTFRVTSKTYAGGASITVRWMDGPADRLVDIVVGQFAGGRFDASIDLAYSITHWMMPDGSVQVASNPGTQGSMGSHAAEREWMPHPDAKLVRFGANYVHTSRDYSDAFTGRVLAKLRRDGWKWEDAGAISRGWPERANTAQITERGRMQRGNFREVFTLSDVLHATRHAFMVA